MAKMNIIIGASISGLQAGLNKAKSMISGLGSSVKSAMGSVGGQLAGLFGAGALIAFGRSAINAADQVADGSKRIGVSAEEYQKLSYAAKQTGTDVSSVESAFKKMSSTVTDAIAGNKTAEATLNALGISLDEVKGKTPNQLFELMADSLSQVSSETEKAALAQDIFGKGGMALIPMLGTYRELGAEIEAAGGIMSNEAVAAADAFNDSMSKLVTTLQSGLMNSGLVDWLKNVADGMNAVVSNSELLKKTNTATSSNSYTGGVKGFFGNLKDAYFGESEGQKLNSYAPDVKKEIAAKKAEKTNSVDRAAKADEFKKMQESEKLLAEYGKEQKKLEAEGIKEQEQIDGSIKALQEKINIQKMINAGKEREAAIQEAINAASDKGALSDEQRAAITSGAGELYDLSQKSGKVKSIDMASPEISDSVKRIGGSIGGANNAISNAQLDVQKKILDVASNIASGMLDPSKGLRVNGTWV